VQVSLIVKMKKLDMRYLAGEVVINSSWLTVGQHKLEFQDAILDKKVSKRSKIAVIIRGLFFSED